MDIDTSAPLAARKDTVIQAPIETVWALQTDMERWPEWQKDISTLKLEGPLAPGTIFRWKAAGLNIVSTLQEVAAPSRIGWTGKSLGMTAIHNWRFTPEGSATRVYVEESLAGWMPRLLKLFNRRFLDQSLEKSLQTLKDRAERA